MPVLPSSGQLTMAAIESAFDGNTSLGYNLSSYYGKSRGLPTSGQITFNDFYGINGGATVTVGSYEYFTVWTYGYVEGVAGSIADAFFDNGSNEAEIAGLSWSDTNVLRLRLEGVISNSNSTFHTLEIDGNTFTRSSATYTNNTTHAYFDWSTSTNWMGTSGTRDVKLRAS